MVKDSMPAPHLNRIEKPRLLLASASPRRHDILCQLGLTHHVVVPPSPDGQEEPQLAGEDAQDYVVRTAREKVQRTVVWLKNITAEQMEAQASGADTPPPSHAPLTPPLTGPELFNAYILAADTTVIADDEILGKPKNPDHAADMLRQLSGSCHKVMTAIALWHAGKLSEDVITTTVEFATLSDAAIASYCNTQEPMGKAGAYGIQGRAAAFVKHLSGSYFNVVGLPTYETLMLLKEAGYPIDCFI